MKRLRYLVTGGCGFIGSHLVKALLDKGHEVVVLDDLSTGLRENISPAAELHVGDICDSSILQALMQTVDGCFHLAAIASVTKSTRQWIATHEVNLTGSIRVFDAARLGPNNKPIPVVFASSSAVYGDTSHHPRAETAPLCPHTPYGADKLAAEYHAHVGFFIYGLSVIGLRFFNIYGPRQSCESDSAAVVPIFIENTRNDQPLIVHGDGKQVRDFVYVDDAVNAVMSSMAFLEKNSPYFGIFNVCTGHATSINHLARIIMKYFHKDLAVQHIEERLGDIKFSLGHPKKLQEAIGVSAQFSLEQGLADYFVASSILT